MDLIPMDPRAAVPVHGSNPIPPKPDLTLSRKAKAAIVVRLLLNNGADIPLEDLPEELQIKLTQQMGKMRVVDRDTLAHVIAEFTYEVERIGLSFSGGLVGALTAMDGKLSRQTADRLRKEAGVRQTGDPWVHIREMGTDALTPIMEHESIEVAAVLLSKLDVPKAAELLGAIPGPRARQITYAVSQTSSVTPDVVDRIGLSLAIQLSVQPLRAFDEGPVERVGAILNSSTSFTRDDMLEGLTETDEEFATAVRKAIFTFANIPARINGRDIPGILRGIDQADLVIALAGAEAAGMQVSTNYILENMSGRMADQLREEIEEAPKPKTADVEVAMGRVVGAIRQMEAAGELTFISEEEKEEE
ncbi:MAG: flagellar motor switch protein FliG [Ascidiaceihabitans sp.]|jgi:flagellar motor switch protein FliG|tara:strand:- start:3348 stop:4430 length:1083 start_codon:yes stop_codon:yes gene_type:complete